MNNSSKPPAYTSSLLNKSTKPSYEHSSSSNYGAYGLTKNAKPTSSSIIGSTAGRSIHGYEEEQKT